MARQLKALFCEQFECPESEFEQRVFEQCLYPHARLVAPLIRRVLPDIFAADFKFIQEFGAATSMREARTELLDFHDANRSTENFLRSTFKLRVSGRKATQLAGKLFARTHDRAAA